MKFFMFLIIFISLIVFSCDKNPAELENNTTIDVWKTDLQVDRETTLKYPENIFIPTLSRMYGYNVRAGYIKSISYISSSSDELEKEFSIKLSDEIGNSIEFNSKTGLSEKHDVNLNMINFYKVEIIRPNDTRGTVFLTVYVTVIPN